MARKAGRPGHGRPCAGGLPCPRQASDRPVLLRAENEEGRATGSARLSVSCRSAAKRGLSPSLTPGEVADEVGFRDDPDETEPFDHRKASDLVFEEHLGAILERDRKSV